MKKIISLLLCLVIMAASVIPVQAAYMGLSASASSVNRGGSFSVYVSLSNDQECGYGGIVLNYDSSVFTMTGGSCSVSGATLAEVSPGRGGGVFALAENRVVSGTIFTINFTVNPNAPLGTYTISGSASMDIGCGAGSTSVTVTCPHEFSAWKRVDAANHTRSCPLCTESETAPHRWNAGTESKAATCMETGIRTFKCLDCGETRDEVIPLSTIHAYADWKEVNELRHSGVCTLCKKTDEFAHTWTTVAVTKPATCTETGLQDVKCVLCGALDEQVIEITEHPWGEFVQTDGEQHTHSCTACGVEESLPHNWAGKYGHDLSGHYQTCTDCGFQTEHEAHTPGDKATYYNPQVCTVCGRVITPAGNHKHNYAETWSADAESHWFACDGCDEQSGLRFHTYSGDCDVSCDVCGWVREAPHNWPEEAEYNTKVHWYTCLGCGEIGGWDVHTPGAPASIYAPQTCTVCGAELAKRLEHPHEFVQIEETHYHICECGDVTEVTTAAECELCAAAAAAAAAQAEAATPPPAEEETPAEFPWMAVGVAEAALLAVLTLLLLKKKKN